MSVYKRGSNWYIDYYVSGRRRREKIGPSRKLANDVLRKRLVEVAENRFLSIDRVQKVKFSDFAQTYLALHAQPNKKSWKATDAVYLKHLVARFGESYLHEIAPEMVERYKIERRQQLAAASVNRELACLRVMFSKAIEWGKAKENPVSKVKLFREDNKRLRYLERAEIATLLSDCSPKLRAVVTLALNTGMRKSEIRHLKWQAVDLRRGVIELLETKNGQKRYVHLNRAARAALEGVSPYPASPYVFSGRDGKPYDFRTAFRTALRRSSIADFRFHDLRHTFASHLAMAGVDLNTLRELLGHKDLAMTLRYAHLSPAHRAQAVEVLDERMGTVWSQTPGLANGPDSAKVVTRLDLAV